MGTEATSLTACSVLVAIDDTDNLDSRGTGFLAQRLMEELEGAGLGTPLGATRHQLLVDPRIPYTSHNSSACLALDSGPVPDVPGIIACAGTFLERRSAAGSDPGLAVMTAGSWADPAGRARLMAFGRSAKQEVLTQDQARRLAAGLGIHLSGHGGDEGGVIGSLAALGLHLSGADGLFLWMPGVRALSGQLTYAELRSHTPIDTAQGPGGEEPDPGDVIDLGDWVRPLLRDGQAVLLLERQRVAAHWEAAPRDIVKQFSHV